MDSFHAKRSKTPTNLKDRNGLFARFTKKQESYSQKKSIRNTNSRQDPCSTLTDTSQSPKSYSQKERNSLSLHRLAHQKGYQSDANSSSVLYSVFNKKKHSLEKISFINSYDQEMSTNDENMESFFKDIEKNKQYLQNQRQQPSPSSKPNTHLLKMIENNGEIAEKLYKQVCDQAKIFEQETQKRKEEVEKSSRQSSPLFGVQNDEISQKTESQKKKKQNLSHNEGTFQKQQQQQSLNNYFLFSSQLNASNLPYSARGAANHFTFFSKEQLNGNSSDRKNRSANQSISKKQDLHKQKNPSQSPFILLGNSKQTADKRTKQHPSFHGSTLSTNTLRSISKEKFQQPNQLYQHYNQTRKAAQNNISSMNSFSSRNNQGRSVSTSPNRQKTAETSKEITSSKNCRKPIFILKNKKSIVDNQQIKNESQIESDQDIMSPSFTESVKNPPQQQKNKMILIKGNNSKRQDSGSIKLPLDTQNQILSQLEKLAQEGKEKDMQINNLENKLYELTQFITNSEKNVNYCISNNIWSSFHLQNYYFQENQNKEVISSDQKSEGTNCQRGSFAPNSLISNQFESKQSFNGWSDPSSEEKNIINLSRIKQRQISFSVQNDSPVLEDSTRNEDLQIGGESQYFGKEFPQSQIMHSSIITSTPIEQILQNNFYQVQYASDSPLIQNQGTKDFYQSINSSPNNTSTKLKFSNVKDNSNQLKQSSQNCGSSRSTQTEMKMQEPFFESK